VAALRQSRGRSGQGRRGLDWGAPNIQTGSVALILRFLDDVIRTGYKGKDGSLLKARDAGEKYLRDVVLPEWSRNPTFGTTTGTGTIRFTRSRLRASSVTHDEPARGLSRLETDVRNIMSLNFCRQSVNPGSMGDVYSGAWAFPESSSCCEKSLQYPITATAATFAEYAALTGDIWAKEISAGK